MKRVFFAVDTSEKAKAIAAERIAAFKKEFSSVRASWVRPENLHVTLRFVGDAEDVQIDSLVSRLAAAFDRTRPFTVALGSPSGFGKRVLSIGIEDETDALLAVNGSLETACERVGFPRETRSFKPHLTLARIRDERGTRDLIEKHSKTQIEPAEWEVREIVLYESELRPTGSVYSKIKTFQLSDA